jgi:periplasmic protein TonB
MRAGRRPALGLLLLGSTLCSCRRKPEGTVTLPVDPTAIVARSDEPPVPLDAEPPVEYPPVLYQLQISGTVLLRLFADETGHIVADSTRIQESSGYPALDSAALAAVPKLHFAPALHNGVAVATLFSQPVRFRHPDRGGTTP